MSLSTFTVVHVVISLIGIVAGFIALGAMLRSQPVNSWTHLFLAFTLLTSLTGFLFPSSGPLTPAQTLGFISIAVLVVTLPALYIFHLRGVWRWIYVIGAVLALYFNTFVAVVQAFQKVPFLHPLAPTQAEPPFQIAQGVLLLAMIVLGFLSVRKFHPDRAAV
jgi:hypothetical protein